MNELGPASNMIDECMIMCDLGFPFHVCVCLLFCQHVDKPHGVRKNRNFLLFILELFRISSRQPNLSCSVRCAAAEFIYHG